MHKKLSLAALLTAAIATPTLAEGQFDFSGFYIGVGYESLNGGVTRFSDTSENPRSSRITGNGFQLNAGYMHPVQRFLIGPELSYKEATGQFNFVFTDGTGTDGYRTYNSVDRIASVGLRLGYPIGKTMPFVKLSYGIGRTKYTNVFPNSNPTNEQSHVTGITLGAEHALSDKLSASLSLQHDMVSSDHSNSRIETNAVQIGLNYRF